MTFANPGFLLLLIPLAIIMGYVFWSEIRTKSLEREFLSSLMLERLRTGGGRRSRLRKLALRGLGLACFCVTLAGPQWGTEKVPVEHELSDVVFAVDCSRSMLAEDVKPNRMTLARKELRRLMSELEGNRLGLVGFAGSAYILSPLTLDVSATQTFLEQLNQNAIPVQGTSLSEAIKVSLVLLREKGEHSRAIVLLTDGEDQDNQALEWAKVAADEGVGVFTIGIGSTSGAKIPDPEEGTVKNRQGQEVLSKLDEETLKKIAEMTGGTYTHVDEKSPDLGELASQILGMKGQRVVFEGRDKPVLRYQWTLLLGIFLLGAAELQGRKEVKQ